MYSVSVYSLQLCTYIRTSIACTCEYVWEPYSCTCIVESLKFYELTKMLVLIRPLFGDFMFFISLPHLFLLPAFFTIINNFLAKFKF